MGGTITEEDLKIWENGYKHKLVTPKQFDDFFELWEMQERQPVIDAVCDAVEIYCGGFVKDER